MKLFYKRQLTKLTKRAEIQVLISDLDGERRRIKNKTSEIKRLKSPSLEDKDNLEFLARELNALNTIRGECVIKISEIKNQEKINNSLSFNTAYAEIFLQIASSVLNKTTFNKIQVMALVKLNDESATVKNHVQEQRTKNTLSLPKK